MTHRTDAVRPRMLIGLLLLAAGCTQLARRQAPQPPAPPLANAVPLAMASPPPGDQPPGAPSGEWLRSYPQAPRGRAHGMGREMSDVENKDETLTCGVCRRAGQFTAPVSVILVFAPGMAKP